MSKLRELFFHLIYEARKALLVALVGVGDLVVSLASDGLTGDEIKRVAGEFALAVLVYLLGNKPAPPA